MPNRKQILKCSVELNDYIGSVSDILHCGTCGCGGIEFSTYPLIFAILSVIGQPNLLFQIRECFSLDAIDYLNRGLTQQVTVV